ncbi:MAG: hypothetical protein QOC71_62 [Thermoplasmata archaeon]|nr:hypothetical protein [Thermoplasmata archaeon]
MRWSVVALVAAIALLAGCLEDAAAPPAQADMQPEEPGRTARSGRGGQDRDENGKVERDGNVTLRSYADEFGLTLTSVDVVLQVGSIQGYNCVGVSGAPYTIRNGTATLTWTSQSALTDSLDLDIRTWYGNDVDEHASGTSPLVIEFKDLELTDDPDDYLTFGALLTGPAAASYELDVSMALAFDYESDADVDPFLTYC